MLKSLLDDTIFQSILAFCTIFSTVIGILALIPTTRDKIFFKKNTKQKIEGDNNLQSGGNISNDKKSMRNNDQSQSSMHKVNQTIKGNGNRQAGGNINE